jgi:hypothetical protein
MIERQLDDLRRRIYRRKFAYQSIFLAPDHSAVSAGRIVLKDLAKFCHSSTPPTRKDMTGRVDPLATAQAIGRMEVWMRIQGFLHLPEREVADLALGQDD